MQGTVRRMNGIGGGTNGLESLQDSLHIRSPVSESQ
jgi:hypothetical protein